MKIKLRLLGTNPFRGADYPLEQKRVNWIAGSIRTTGFWENLIVRPAPPPDLRSTGAQHFKSFQIAYGHHRLAALHLLMTQQVLDGDYELELPVRLLDDATMVRIMAAENDSDHTVLKVREFIAEQCGIKFCDIGPEDIQNFVGYEVWALPKIRAALKRLKS